MAAPKAPWHPPEPMSDAQLARFLSHIEMSPTGCWLWTGALEQHGYGRVRIGDTHYLAHRASYLHFIGAISAPELDHLCRTKPCCNPTHVEPVSRLENHRRWKVMHTHCPAGHELTPGNVYRRKNRPDRKGDCRLCVLDRAHRKRQKVA